MVKSIYEFTEIITFLNARISSMPSRGRGESKRMAEAVRVSPAYLSQMLNAAKPLGMDHAILIAKHLNLSLPETDYFLELTRLELAGNKELKNYSQEKLTQMRREVGFDKSDDQKKTLSESEMGLLFSNWQYDAVRLTTSISELNSAKAVSDYLNIPIAFVDQIIRFLLRTGLCKEEEGRIINTKRFIKLDSKSPYVDRHLLNWRSLASERIPHSNPADLFHSLPMPITEVQFQEIRAQLKTLISKTEELSKESSAEKIICLNLDLFEVQDRKRAFYSA